MTTKEQERKALEKIRKILDELDGGEPNNSYVSMALEGCLEIAEENIENDWGCSMKQRAESAEEKVAKLELDNRDLRLAVAKAKESSSKEITALQLRIEELQKKTLSPDDLTDCRALVDNEACEAEKEMRGAAHEIVTFAEEPNSANFQEAVRMNRAASSKWNYLLGIRGRIDKALGTGV